MWHTTRRQAAGSGERLSLPSPQGVAEPVGSAGHSPSAPSTAARMALDRCRQAGPGDELMGGLVHQHADPTQARGALLPRRSEERRLAGVVDEVGHDQAGPQTRAASSGRPGSPAMPTGVALTTSPASADRVLRADPTARPGERSRPLGPLGGAGHHDDLVGAGLGQGEDHRPRRAAGAQDDAPQPRRRRRPHRTRSESMKPAPSVLRPTSRPSTSCTRVHCAERGRPPARTRRPRPRPPPCTAW